MKDNVDEFKNDYGTYESTFLTSKWILEKVPYIFGGNVELYLNTKIKISKLLGVDSCAIIFVGSSCTGFSLSPYKVFQPFNENSDIDIAIISHYYFDVAWKQLRDINMSHQPIEVQNAITEHKERLIYWGTIATDKILGLMPFGRSWLTAIQKLQEIELFENRDIKFRLYRDHESLRAYHIHNFKTKIYEVVNAEAKSIELK